MHLEKEDGTFVEVSCNLNENESSMSLENTRGTAYSIG